MFRQRGIFCVSFSMVLFCVFVYYSFILFQLVTVPSDLYMCDRVYLIGYCPLRCVLECSSCMLMLIKILIWDIYLDTVLSKLYLCFACV
jgi:hypothetical protein